MNLKTHLKQLSYNAKAHQGFRRYFANISWMFSEQILRMVAGLVVGIWVARYLGPEQFGIFSYAIAFASLFGGIAKLGLDSIVVRNLVHEPNQRDEYLGTAFWLKLGGALTMLAAIGVAINFTTNDSITNLYIFIIASGAIFQSFEVVDFYFQSKVLSKFVSICKLIQLFVSSFIKLFLIFLQADLVWFVLVSLIDQVILALTLYLAYRYQKIGFFFRRFNLITAKGLLLDSWPLILSSMVVVIYMRIDQIMIKEMLGEKDVGIYSAAIKLSELWNFIPVLISNALFPSIINAKKVSEALYHARLQKLFTFLVWISILLAIPMTIASNWLVVLLYGIAYKEAGEVLVIHIWASVFVAMGVASGSWFAIEGLQRYAFYRTALGALANVGLNLVMIPLYGIVGAAIATVISYMMAGMLFDVCTKRTRGIFYMKIGTFVLNGVKK